MIKKEKCLLEITIDLIKESGLSYKEIGEKLDLPYHFIWAVAKRKNKTSSVIHIQRIYEFLSGKELFN